MFDLHGFASIFVVFMGEWFTKTLTLPFQKLISLESILKTEGP